MIPSFPCGKNSRNKMRQNSVWVKERVFAFERRKCSRAGNDCCRCAHFLDKLIFSCNSGKIALSETLTASPFFNRDTSVMSPSFGASVRDPRSKSRLLPLFHHFNMIRQQGTHLSEPYLDTGRLPDGDDPQSYLSFPHPPFLAFRYIHHVQYLKRFCR